MTAFKLPEDTPIEHSMVGKAIENAQVKVETHNFPSAIEPYGGAMTGSGGVFRDVLGTGLGAKPIASTDIFSVLGSGARGHLFGDFLHQRLPFHSSRRRRAILNCKSSITRVSRECTRRPHR